MAEPPTSLPSQLGKRKVSKRTRPPLPPEQIPARQAKAPNGPFPVVRHKRNHRLGNGELYLPKKAAPKRRQFIEEADKIRRLVEEKRRSQPIPNMVVFPDEHGEGNEKVGYGAANQAVVEDKAPGYTRGTPPSQPAVTPQQRPPMEEDTAKKRIIARVEKMSPAKLAALEQVIDDFERSNGETTTRGMAVTNDDTRLGRLQARYEMRLRNLVLPPGGFTTKAEAKAGHRLYSTLCNLQEVQRELNLPVTKTPDRVLEAERMAKAYRDHHTKSGEFIPPRPRGRPRRVPAEMGLSA
jgi:hypothetical protein